MTKYPLLFTFKDRLEIRGSLVEVTVHGRVLAAQEPEGWWFYGAQPGDLAESGATPGEAQAAFRKAFSEVLVDIAGSAVGADSFAQEVRDWFEPVNAPVQDEWLAAVEDVRAGRVNAELERKPADTPRWVEVHVVKRAREAPLQMDPPMEVAA